MADPVATLDDLRRLGQGGRGIEDSVSYALGHRIRIEILAALHEGPETADGLARIVGRPLSTVTHHIDELLKDGSIAVAWTKPIRSNMTQNYYRVVELPEFSDEEVAAMTPEEQQAIAAVIVQAATAEALASLWAGKMVNAGRIMLAWNRITLDEKGKADVADEQAGSWERIKRIECDSANRLAESNEQGTTHVVTAFFYERSRNSAPPPLPLGKHLVER